MRLNSLKILKISISTSPKQKILEEIKKYLAQRSKLSAQNSKIKTKPLVIVTPNPEQIVLAQKNHHFADILNRAAVRLPDGIGVIWASRLLGNSQLITQNSQTLRQIPGVEFMEDLVKLAANEGYPIALIGGRHNLAVKVLDRLHQKYSGLSGWAQDGPEIVDLKFPSDYVNSMAKKIVSTKTRFIFVGLGAPKQEFLIDQLRAYLLNLKSPQVLMAVGGSFEILAGRIPRAPLFLRLMGFEWLWRLIRQPWRWKRQLALLTFVWLVIKEKWWT